ncbi:MAG: protein-glutamate O-methyltransferase CheR [Isosphaeraceae bacterium]|nr:protein-glutamate O-methyltransferase CheR [Isosphaeraceae bacterium]
MPADPLPPAPTSSSEPEPWSVEDFAPIVAFLRNRIGITLEAHRMGLLQARLRSRLQNRGYPSFSRFNERVLKVDPNGPGMQLLIDLSTVNHTAFFREPAHFTFMVEKLGPLFKDPTGFPIRIWSAGCSTGQEPFSIAMALAEAVPTLNAQKVEIWATDLSLEVVKTAARAIYSTREVVGVSPVRLRRFFMRGKGPKDGSFRVVPELRDIVKYRHLDLRTATWPLPGDFHMIFCRNVSIYFAEDERMNLLNRLATFLRPGGWLAMGNGEILPGVPSSLRKIEPSIYRKEI